MTDDAVLLDAAVAGDAAAFAHLYDAHAVSVYRYALRIVRNAADAEDVAQETFTIAWDKRATIRVIDRSLLPWLLVTSRNVAFERLRRRRRDAAHMPIDSAPELAAPDRSQPDVVVWERTIEEAIAHAVDELTPTDQVLFQLCITEGLSYNKAAAALGISHGAIRNRLARIRASLRIKLHAQKEGMS